MRSKALWLIPDGLALAAWAAVSFRVNDSTPTNFPPPDPDAAAPESGPQRATFGSGCFCCSEAVFQNLKGRGAGGAGL